VVRGYSREILQGLDYLHSNKILHRDIKGPNILVDFAGVCKLSDFGCSKELYGEIASTMTLKGTPQFMAPEVLRNHGKGYTEKADIWSVGCTVIEMCTARRPWPEFNTNEAVMYHVAMREACPKTPDWVSAECRDFCALCFARDPTKRPNVSELLKHPLVHNAELDDEQRLGTHAADPAEISFEVSEHVKGSHSASLAVCPLPAAAEADVSSAASASVVSATAAAEQSASEPAIGLAPLAKRRPVAKGLSKGPMGGVVLRKDPDEDDDNEDSCSSDDGDEDGVRTPAAETLLAHTHVRKPSTSSSMGLGLGGGSHAVNEMLSCETSVRAARRPLAESLVRDVDSALQMVEQVSVCGWGCVRSGCGWVGWVGGSACLCVLVWVVGWWVCVCVCVCVVVD